MENKNLTGYPSKDKPWLKYYAINAPEIAVTYPKNKSLWDIIEDKLIEQGNDVPALEYFGRKISREDFRKTVYKYAAAFKAFGIAENEIVSVYSPWFPEIAYSLCALNLIGAVSYFLKLEMPSEALAEETSESRAAIVFDGMWENVKGEFEKDRFEKVIFISASDSMPFPLKQIVGARSPKSKLVRSSSKYVYFPDFIKRYSSYKGRLRADFVSGRTAFITSSSGTSGGVVKGIMSTNEAAIIQQLHPMAAGMSFTRGTKCLVNLPPTAATALNCLFLNSLYYNVTAIIEPRLSENEYYAQILKYKPALTLMTGAFWETFFRMAYHDIKIGRTPDLSFLEMPIIGGDGTNVSDIRIFNKILKMCGCKAPMMPGYGLSETFATIAFSHILGESGLTKKAVSPVGVPSPAVTVGVFDDNGRELEYNERGELWIKTPTMMKGYFGKEDLSRKVSIDGWIHSGDMFEIDENGILYFYGRKSDSVTAANGETIYLFDLTNELLKDKAVKYAMVNFMGRSEEKTALAVHLVLKRRSAEPLTDVLRRLDKKMERLLPDDIVVKGFKLHEKTFRASPTTAKKDRNGYIRELDGYLKYNDGKLIDVSFE